MFGLLFNLVHQIGAEKPVPIHYMNDYGRRPVYKFNRIPLFLAVVFSLAATVAAQVNGTVYQDPQGQFTVPVPQNWTVSEEDGYVQLSAPEEELLSRNNILGAAVEVVYTAGFGLRCSGSEPVRHKVA